ncbi:MAG TPA: ankyrin repeat domain-containing protein [Bryobacteraceae bacterium]|nr:ankyrin repeat domain-containing protein [Bryobacteraceae bacterium]
MKWIVPAVLSVVALQAAPNLADYAMNADKQGLRTLLQQKTDVNAAQADGMTALHWAVRQDDLDTAKLLIHAGANVQAATRLGITPLAIACSNANAALIRLLLSAGANPNFAGENGETALMIASRLGDIEPLRALLDGGAEVNAKDTAAQSTALMVAIRENHPEVVKLLIAHGADVNTTTRVGQKPAPRAPNAGGGSHGAGINRGGVPERGQQDPTPGGMTPLLYAARDGELDLAQMLVGAGADVNTAEANKINPLQMAIENGHVGLAKFLLDHGADINAADYWGRAPLWLAVEMRNLDTDKFGENGVDRASVLTLVQALLDRGANVNARTTEYPPIRKFIMPLNDLSWVDITGQTPFFRAALSGDVTVMRLLLDKGADPKISTVEGTTTLMAAAGVNWVGGQTYTESKESLLDAVKLCFEKGVDVNAANSMGITAVMAAANRGSNDIIEFLVGHGARLDVKDKQGRSPLTWAEGVFLATNPPQPKPESMALIHKLTDNR